MSDELLNSLKQDPQDQDSWSRLYQTMRPWVFGNCFRWLNNLADAEDATQKTFVHLAMHWHRLSFDDWPELREYLKRTSSSRSIDLFRQRRRLQRGLQSDEDLIEYAESGDQTFDPQTADELIENLDLSTATVASISERQKETLWLAYLGNANEEIAQSIGVSPRTIRRDLAEAWSLIRKGEGNADQ
jgi:RNA polymerase sigma factor (sigma-70 family)